MMKAIRDLVLSSCLTTTAVCSFLGGSLGGLACGSTASAPETEPRSNEAKTNADVKAHVGRSVETPPVEATSKAAPGAQPAEKGLILTFGTIADNPQEEDDKDAEHAAFFPYLVGQLAGVGVSGIDLAYCHNPADMGRWIAEGKVDIFDESPFASYVAHRIGGADEPIANRWKNGNEKFGSVIFASAAGDIDSLDDLKGKHIIFRGDTSTANYFNPKTYLVAQGYKVVEKKGPDDPVAPDEIGYYFVWSSRDKEIESVMAGEAAAGGVSDEFVDQLLGKDVGPVGSARHPTDAKRYRKEDLRILARVPPTLRRVVTLRKDLDPKIKAAIKDVLIRMHETPEGRAVLAKFGPTSRFSPVETDEFAYQGIIDKGELLEEEVRKFSALPPKER